MSNALTNTMYIVSFLVLVPFWYKILQALKVERIFIKGKIYEIRLFYVFITLILSKLTTDSLFVMVEKVKNIFELV